VRPRDFIVYHNIRPVVCCFSGGKDSLVATHYTLNDIEDAGLNVERYVVHVDTTVALPGVQDYVRSVARQLDWPLVILHPKVPFDELVQRWGMPTMRRRWCCYYLKLEPIRDFVRSLSPGIKCEVLGLRKAESVRRRNLPGSFLLQKGMFAVWKYAPIIDWSDEDVARYIARHNLPVNPLYKLVRTSGECWCGIYTKPKVLDILATKFPEWFERFVRLEESFRSGGTAFYLQNRPISAKEFARRVRLTDFLEAEK